MAPPGQRQVLPCLCVHALASPTYLPREAFLATARARRHPTVLDQAHSHMPARRDTPVRSHGRPTHTVTPQSRASVSKRTSLDNHTHTHTHTHTHRVASDVFAPISRISPKVGMGGRAQLIGSRLMSVLLVAEDAGPLTSQLSTWTISGQPRPSQAFHS